MKTVYEIMHANRCAARIDTQGHCSIQDAQFLPYDLWMEEAEDIDTLVNNITNFNYWCAGRVLTLDRQYAKEILNSIGALQATTDRDRAKISLTYRCVSLTDVFWVREMGDTVTFEDVNLYDNHLSNAFVDISLRGKQMTANNQEMAKDLSTGGCFPKAWVRREDGFYLYKDGGSRAVEDELLASKIARCFDCPQVLYDEDIYEGEKVSVSRIITTKSYSIVPMSAFQVYTMNQDLDFRKEILSLDAHGYYMMNILDYLTGNTDRHWGNWGVLVDNTVNRPVSLHPLMDFNMAFHAYEDSDGANCQTEFPRRLSQREAALEAVKETGLNMISEVKRDWFANRESEYKMFVRRLNCLKKSE